MAKRRKKVRRGNPEKFRATLKRPTGAVTKAGKKKYAKVKSHTSDTVMTAGEIAAAKARIRIMKERVRGAKGPIRKKALAQVAAIKKALGAKVVHRDQVKNQMAMFKQMAETATPGDKVSTKTIVVAGKKRKVKKSKKRSAKRKSAKRSMKRKAKAAVKRHRKAKRKSGKRRSKKKSSGRSILLARKGSKAVIRSSKKRSAPKLSVIKTSSNPGKKRKKKNSKKRSSKRRSKAITLLAGGKGRSIRIIKGKGKKKKSASFRFRANPLGGTMGAFEKFTGHSIQEAGSLALGGALYGAINKVVATQASKVPGVGPALAAVQKVPVVGPAIPTLLVGALLNFLGERQGIKAAKVVGTGLIGASVVGMGVSAAQVVPGLSSLSGVDYTPDGMGMLPQGLGEIPYGMLPEGLGDGADFGGVDYTLDGAGQMGEIPYGDVEYTEDVHSEDFGHEGQMG